MTTEELKRIFRFRKRMITLTNQIKRAEQKDASAQLMRVERATLNLAMMHGYGVCVDLSTNELVAFEDEPNRYKWIEQLEAAVHGESATLLQGVLRRG
jgi:hypothetical protein